jgi:hypothetical protein
MDGEYSKYVQNFLSEKLNKRRSYGRPKRRCNNNKIYFRYTACQEVRFIKIAEDRLQCSVSMNAVFEFRYGKR